MRFIKSKWAGHAAPMVDMKHPHKILAGEPKGRRQLGRHRRR